MDSSFFARRSSTQTCRILARATMVEAWGAALGARVNARVTAAARNAMAARPGRRTPGGLAKGLQRSFMMPPIGADSRLESGSPSPSVGVIELPLPTQLVLFP